MNYCDIDVYASSKVLYNKLVDIVYVKSYISKYILSL